MNMRSYTCCVPSDAKSKSLESLSTLLKLIGEPSRLRILCILLNGSHCVCEIEEHSNLSQSLISHHLKDLKEYGLLEIEKRQQRIYYSLTNSGKRITDIIFQIPTKEIEL